MPGIDSHPETHLTGRQRSRLRRARENGYLNASCRDNQKLIAAYARWCWRLRIPIVWSERRSPYSRFGVVHLDLYTTPHRLTAAGQSEMQALAPATAISPHDARWGAVPLGDLDRVAAAVLRAAVRPDHYQPNRIVLPSRLPAKVLSIDQPRAAIA